MDVFAPFAREEFLRFLKPGGWLIYAVPGPEHLFGLKQALYDTPYKNPWVETEYEGFVRRREVPVSGEITLNQEKFRRFCHDALLLEEPSGGYAAAAEPFQPDNPIQFRFLLYQKQ